MGLTVIEKVADCPGLMVADVGFEVTVKSGVATVMETVLDVLAELFLSPW